MSVSLDSVQREQTKLPTSQFFHWRSLTSYFTSGCLRVQLLFKPHLGADWIPSWSLKELESTFLAFSLWLVPSVKPSYQLLPGRSLPTHIAPTLLWLPPKGLFPKWPMPRNLQTLAFMNHPGPRKTKRQFYLGMSTPSNYSLWFSTEWVCKNIHSWFIPNRDYTTYLIS